MEMNDRFLRACRREPVDVTPVWFMRQAGRYMAEYRAVREKHSLLEICYQPELAAEVTLQPVRALGVDAEERPDGFEVRGEGRAPAGGQADAAGDHRLVMAFAIVALGSSGPTRITGADVVAVSYPDFVRDLTGLTS